MARTSRALHEPCVGISSLLAANASSLCLLLSALLVPCAISTKMVAFLAISVLLVIYSACDAAGSSSLQDHHFDLHDYSPSLKHTHHMHRLMRARRLPITMMAYQRFATNIDAGNRFQRHMAAYVTNPTTTRRKRRRNFLGVMSMDNTDPTTIVTQYTINDSVCPPTEPDTLKKIVQKHIHTLPRYWFSRPVAKHTAEAFQEAMGK